MKISKETYNKNKIKLYIKETYKIPVEETKSIFFENSLLIKNKKYNIKISICKPDKNHYLYGKYESVLFLEYSANKKYQLELNHNGGGYSIGFDENNFNNIDEFLKKWFNKKEDKQLNIYDVLENL